MGTEEQYKKYILEVMDRYIKGEATETDKLELDEWYTKFPPYQGYADGMSASEKLQAKDKMLHNINKQIYQEAIPTKQKHKNILSIVSLAAAIAVIILTTGLLYYLQRDQHHTPQKIAQLIEPGGNKAFLTLADGSRISLNDANNGKIAKEAGVTISKTSDGKLIYTTHSITGNEVNTVNNHNTIETPSGGQYQIQLPDGTSVWLNAASSLKYPVSFSAKTERHVYLTGEAYFEVAKDKARPFVVTATSTSGDQKQQFVEVLGTHFDINAYNDDNTIKTTLLEGSILIKLPSETIKLKPGEQSINTGNDLKVAHVNTEYAVAWKDGYFRFNDKTLEMAMKEICRWYNVNVTFKNASLKDEPLAGTISKYSSIAQVLKKMELAGAFRFTVKAREITIE
jgi:transmembrane sensor